jgi:thiamine pyrophosphokinase
MERYSEFLRLGLAEGGGAWIAGKGRHRIQCVKGETLTLLSVTPSARVTTHGFLYPLRKEILERSSRGLSNRIVTANPQIEVHSGRVWVLSP